MNADVIRSLPEILRDHEWVKWKAAGTTEHFSGAGGGPEDCMEAAGNRLHYEQFITPGAAAGVEIFSEDGTTEFKRVDIWERVYPDDYQPRRTANTG